MGKTVQNVCRCVCVGVCTRVCCVHAQRQAGRRAYGALLRWCARTQASANVPFFFVLYIYIDLMRIYVNCTGESTCFFVVYVASGFIYI